MPEINSERINRKVIENINGEYRRDMENILRVNPTFLRELEKVRKAQTYKKAGKAMKKVASLPLEVDNFFTKVYGQDYYKDPKFFTRNFSEWNVNKTYD